MQIRNIKLRKFKGKITNYRDRKQKQFNVNLGEINIHAII